MVYADNNSISFLYKSYKKSAALSCSYYANLILFVHIWVRKRERPVFFQKFSCELFSLSDNSKLVEIRELRAKFPALKENKHRGSVGKRSSRIVSTEKGCVRRYSHLD